MRETLEEANARVAVDDLYVTVNLPHINQVYMLFRGQLLDLDFSPGEESLEVELVTERDIPGNRWPFRPSARLFGLYFADRAQGRFPVRMLDIVREGGVPAATACGPDQLIGSPLPVFTGIPLRGSDHGDADIP